mmetsp:Transcript_24164/g.78742  ORF Transcript_24164/g.78742 Transcript_24164/m.78742 type:complete len:201 (-) Transcript_24164:381-983(-)
MREIEFVVHAVVVLLVMAAEAVNVVFRKLGEELDRHESGRALVRRLRPHAAALTAIKPFPLLVLSCLVLGLINLSSVHARSFALTERRPTSAAVAEQARNTDPMGFAADAAAAAAAAEMGRRAADDEAKVKVAEWLSSAASEEPPEEEEEEAKMGTGSRALTIAATATPVAAAEPASDAWSLLSTFAESSASAVQSLFSG